MSQDDGPGQWSSYRYFDPKAFAVIAPAMAHMMMPRSASGGNTAPATMSRSPGITSAAIRIRYAHPINLAPYSYSYIVLISVLALPLVLVSLTPALLGRAPHSEEQYQQPGKQPAAGEDRDQPRQRRADQPEDCVYDEPTENRRAHNHPLQSECLPISAPCPRYTAS